MPTTEERFLDFLVGDPTRRVSELARDLSVDRSRIYQLLRKHNYTRVGGQWITTETVERQGDALFQMVTEIHDTVVRRQKIAVHVDMTGTTASEPEREEPKTQPLESWKIQDKKLIIPIQFEKGYPEAEDIQYWADRLASIPTMSREQAQTILLFVANLAVRRMAELKSNNKE